MSFPTDPLPVRAELHIDGAWTDITSYVRVASGVPISRGRKDEGTHNEGGDCRLIVDNSDGRFSPRNPTGAWYGAIGRNTRIRVGVEQPSPWLAVTGGSGAQIHTPDAAVLDITGDIDLRFEADVDWWRDAELVAKWTTAGNQRSWSLSLVDGVPRLQWTTDGTDATVLEARADEMLPSTGHLAVRATLDVNNGAAGHTATFYTSDTVSGTWTQLGSPVVTAGTTSIFSSTAVVKVGMLVTADSGGTSGRIYAAQIRSGIAGTVVANPDLQLQTPGVTSFADTTASPRTWTVQATADLVGEISDVAWRFHGEVSEWPQRWDLSEQDAYVPLACAGPLRRLSQGASSIGSALYRAQTSPGAAYPPVAYWPMEDDKGSTQLASGLAGGRPMQIIRSSYELAAFSDFLCSKPLPTVTDTAFHGIVPAYTPVSGQSEVRFLFYLDSGVNGERIITVYCSGSMREIRVFYSSASSGGIYASAYDTDGTLLDTSGTIVPTGGVNGRLWRVSVDLEQVGADVSYSINMLEVGIETVWVDFGSATSVSFGRVNAIGTNAGGGLTTGTAVYGHISVHPEVTDLFDLASELTGHVGESAGMRALRLCQEEGVTFTALGNLLYDVDGTPTTEPMGAQLPQTLLALLEECADTDGGILDESIDRLGLTYRPRIWMTDTTARLTLDHGTANELGDTLTPTDDDQQTKNDVTVSRTGGSSARSVLESGPLSVQDPPDGVGRYDSTATVNTSTDTRLADIAGWLVHLGTVDEARYPSISINLASPAAQNNPDLQAALVGMQLGDRIDINDPPAGLPPDDIVLRALGYTETLGFKAWTFDINCATGTPWLVGRLDYEARIDTDGSTLAEDLTTTETAVDVATIAGAPLWTTEAAEWPFDIRVGGEVMTVTAISGASSPQTFTVTRSVNSVVKSHLTGADVRLARPTIISL